MKIIILSTLAAVILIAVGVYILLNLCDKIQVEERTYLRLEARWVYGFIGYNCVVATIFIVLVLQTSLTQQQQSLQNTQERFQQELSAFRERLGDQTEKLMSQINEKAELTGSEVEMRGKLKSEIDQHKRTQQELADARDVLKQTQATLNRETAAHQAYLDSLNTARALLASTQNRLDLETRLHGEDTDKLRDTRQNLAQAQERLKVQDNQLKELNQTLDRAQTSMQKALENAALASKGLLQKADEQGQDLKLIQATADSIFKKVMKRPREPESEPQNN